jgi:protein phosphatase
VRSLGRNLAPLLAGALSGQFKDPGASVLTETIDYAIREANREIYRKGQSDPACKGMGATAAVVLIWNGQVLLGHIGDCRVYHQHGGRLHQVTRDQTLVARMVELGQLSAQEALNHPARNEVAQALGKRFDIEPAAHKLQLTRGDWLVIACDGLHTQVADVTLQTTIQQTATASSMAQRLVDLADASGGSDNCTVLAVHCV